MKGFIKLKIRHYTNEGMEVSKWDEERAVEDHTCFRNNYIRIEHISAITTANTEGLCVLYLMCGETLVAKGTCDEIAEKIHIELDVQSLL